MNTMPRALAVDVSERDHIRGNPGGTVTITEYGDYECPFCREAVPLVETLMGALGQHIRLVFRHFPLTKYHPHAEHAAEAAEAAGAQGKFWQMHELLFAHQDLLDDESLVGYAKTLDLDMGRFESELTNRAYKERLQHDLRGGLQSGVRGTPTFFIDGWRYDGPLDLHEMVAVIRGKHAEITDAISLPTQMRVPAVTRHE